VIVVTAGTAPRARALQLRVAGTYLGAVVLGLVLLVATNSPPWQAIGVGLWLPGAGFLLAGAAWWLMFVLVLLLFALCIGAWLRVGAATLPSLLWLAAALGSAGAVGDSTSSAGVQAAVALLLATLTVVIGVWVERIVRVSRQRARRSGYLPYRTALVTTTAAATARDVPPPDELTPEALHGLRLIFDLALQPVGDYTGYDRGRRFGRAALHEQINTCGYALSLAHAHYTPNFRGYSTEAQRQLIETSLRQPVWSFWRVQNAWGNLRLDADPVGRGRMDFTGAFALQVALYTALTRDERYLRLGALTFQGVGGTAYRHDLRGLAALLDKHIADTGFGMAQGPPDWVDVAANLRGLAALHLVDRLTGEQSFDRHAERVETAVANEFFAPDLGFVSARSARTGFGRRYARPGASPTMLLDAFFPDLSVRVWAQQREEHFTERGAHLLAAPGGTAVLEHPAEQTAGFEALYQGAQEHGDRDAAAAALDALDRLARPGSDGTGARQHYPSKLLTFAVILDRLLFRGAWRAMVGVPPAASALDGPMLRDVSYPGVLVAKAASTGTDLALVLYPGAGDGVRELSLSGLVPGRRYRLTTTAGSRDFTSAADGRAVVGAAISGRTAVSIAPV
jgi:linalool dehydratase/isomerase-like protein